MSSFYIVLHNTIIYLWMFLVWEMRIQSKDCQNVNNYINDFIWTNLVLYIIILTKDLYTIIKMLMEVF